jgi:hypothetical protein
MLFDQSFENSSESTNSAPKHPVVTGKLTLSQENDCDESEPEEIMDGWRQRKESGSFSER